MDSRKRKRTPLPETPLLKTSSPLSKRQRTAAPNTTGMDDSTTPLAKLIFGHDAVNNLHKQHIDTRKIWELSNPTTQCTNIIGNPDTTPCWICQMPIGITGGLQPECEHILPIAQAVIYLGLYSAEWKKAPVNRTTGVTYEQLQLEYGWAHQVCNQIKRDRVYIKIVEGKFIVDEGAIVKLINDIWNTERKDSGSFKLALHKQYQTNSNFIKAAQPQIVERYNAICDYLNSTGGGANLHLLAGIVSAAYGMVRKGMVRNSTEKEDTYRLELLKGVSEISTEYDRLINMGMVNIPRRLHDIYMEEAARIKPLYIKLKYVHNNEIYSDIDAYIIVQLYKHVIEKAKELSIRIGPINTKRGALSKGRNAIFAMINNERMHIAETNVAAGTIEILSKDREALFTMFNREKEAHIADIKTELNASTVNETKLLNKYSEDFNEVIKAVNILLEMKGLSTRNKSRRNTTRKNSRLINTKKNSRLSSALNGLRTLKNDTGTIKPCAGAGCSYYNGNK
jgi:hypothetical protein